MTKGQRKKQKRMRRRLEQAMAYVPIDPIKAVLVRVCVMKNIR